MTAKKTTKVPVRRKAARAEDTGGEEQKAPVISRETLTARTPNALKAEEARKAATDRAHRSYVKALQDAEEARAEAGGGAPARAPGPYADAPVTEFVLLAGVHQGEDGKEYRYDRNHETVVKSQLPLDEMFMNKFRRKDGPTHPGRDYREIVDRAGLTDPPLAERRPHGQETQFSRDTDEKARRALAHSRGEDYPPDVEDEGGDEEAVDEGTDGGTEE